MKWNVDEKKTLEDEGGEKWIQRIRTVCMDTDNRNSIDRSYCLFLLSSWPENANSLSQEFLVIPLF
jgi:hypothetical protein